MRVFIAIELEAGLKEQLASISRRLEGFCRGGRFTERDNYHLTLKFIGEADEEQLERLRRSLDSMVEGEEPFRLRLSELGQFPRGGRTILWIGVEESPELKALFNKLERALGMIGISSEERPFTPHLTLGRQVVLKGEFKELAAANPPGSSEFEVKGLSLMESARVEGRLVYRPIHTSPFKADQREEQ